MPHKKSKRTVRDAATAARGYDNAPTSKDTFNQPYASTSTAPVPGAGVRAPEEKKNNKRVKPSKFKVDTFGGRSDLGGLSKNAYRILNAGTLREQYHAQKKAEKEGDGKVSKKAAAKQASTELKPLAYESLSTFNRRVESTLRPDIASTIKSAKAAGKKAFTDAKAKQAADRAVKAAEKKEQKEKEELEAEEGDEEEGENDDKPKPAKAVQKPPPKAASDDTPVAPPKLRVTEFAQASQKRSISDLAIAPPSLKKAKRGLTDDGSMHLPVPAGRIPVNEDLKRLMEMERVKAVRMYREMKEQREKDK